MIFFFTTVDKQTFTKRTLEAANIQESEFASAKNKNTISSRKSARIKEQKQVKRDMEADDEVEEDKEVVSNADTTTDQEGCASLPNLT